MLLDTDWACDHHSYSDAESVDVKLIDVNGSDAENLTDSLDFVRLGFKR